MPTYQYACTECGHRFETVQSFTDDALTDCPQCTGRLRKVFNSVGIVFKGSGFYRTDSREKPKTDAKADAAPGKGKDSGDGAAKPAAAASASPNGSSAKPAASSGTPSPSTAGTAA